MDVWETGHLWIIRTGKKRSSAFTHHCVSTEFICYCFCWFLEFFMFRVCVRNPIASDSKQFTKIFWHYIIAQFTFVFYYLFNRLTISLFVFSLISSLSLRLDSLWFIVVVLLYSLLLFLLLYLLYFRMPHCDHHRQHIQPVSSPHILSLHPRTVNWCRVRCRSVFIHSKCNINHYALYAETERNHVHSHEIPIDDGIDGI